VVSTIFWLGVGVFLFGSIFAIIRFKGRFVRLFLSQFFIGFLLGWMFFPFVIRFGHMGLLRLYQFVGIMFLASSLEASPH